MATMTPRSWMRYLIHSTDAMDQLTDGSAELADGVDTLKSKMGDFKDGVGTLQSGVHAYTDGAGKIASGITQLSDSIPTLSNGVGTLNSSAATIADGVELLDNTLKTSFTDQEKAAMQTQAASAVDAMAEGIKTRHLPQWTAGQKRLRTRRPQ